MQPYLFPNLSYYKLMASVENVVFYNDVQFIKGGWINRNQILYHQSPKPFRLSLVDASSNKRINEVTIFRKEHEVASMLKTVYHAYAKAPFYKPVSDLIQHVLNYPSLHIAEIAEQSIRQVFDYLQWPFFACCSSDLQVDRSAPNKTDRLIALIQHFGKTQYVNSIGGKELYQKEYFQSKGIQLHFISPKQPTYNQFKTPFVPGLSMIDVLMFNDIPTIHHFLQEIEFE
ncbi:MAG: WbqC family protein [Chitinophagaceae bacterium]|nr:WbqC family protein [Chitinophagaceae bacterium]